MRRRSRSTPTGNLVTTREAAERNRSLGFGPGDKPRGFGFDPPADSAAPAYTQSQRIRDATALFITQCARAYIERRLTEWHPPRGNVLAPEIRKAGGNIKWLSSNPDRRWAFHNEYCRLAGQFVPYESVWHDNKRSADAPRRGASVKTKAQRRSERMKSRQGNRPAK